MTATFANAYTIYKKNLTPEPFQKMNGSRSPTASLNTNNKTDPPISERVFPIW